MARRAPVIALDKRSESGHPRRTMQKNQPWGLLLVLAALMTTACVEAPVYQPQSTVPTTAAQPDLRAAILAGLAAKGWRVAREGPGVIEATVRAGGHTATVAIRYGGNQYSIQHVSSSEGLKYDGETIHRRYNHWVRLLDDAIYKAATQGAQGRPPHSDLAPLGSDETSENRAP